jgi:colanic acid biosynthesis glycosyl transferase WcaI
MTDVLFVHQYYHPEFSAVAQMLTDLAEGLAQGGLKVAVITGRGRYLPGNPPLPAGCYTRSAVRVQRLNSSNFGKGRFAGRFLDYLTYTAAAAVRILSLGVPRVTVFLTTPPFIELLGSIPRHRGGQTLQWMQDLYPDIAQAVQGSALKGCVFGLLNYFACLTRRHLGRIVAITDGMKARIAQKGFPPERISVIPNWADGRAIRPLAHMDNPFRKAHQLQDRFVLLYSGNMGLAHDFQTLLDALARLRHDPRLLLLFVGDGAARASVMEFVRREKLPNVRFLPYQPREELGHSLTAADLSIVTMKSGAEGQIFPSKLYGCLAAGRPILCIGSPAGEISELLKRHGCGVTLAPGDVEGVVKTLQSYMSDTARCHTEALRAREAFDRYYSREAATEAWLDLIVGLFPNATPDAAGPEHITQAPSLGLGASQGKASPRLSNSQER